MGFAAYPNTGDHARSKVAGTQESCARIDGPCEVTSSGPDALGVAVLSPKDGSHDKRRVLDAGESFTVESGEQVEVWAVGSGEAGLYIDRSPRKKAPPKKTAPKARKATAGKKAKS